LLNAELNNNSDETFLQYLLGRKTQFAFLDGDSYRQFLLTAAAFIRQASAVYFTSS
jgi:hypothetical protein